MKRKRYILIAGAVVLMAGNISAQTLKPDITTTTGDYYSNAAGSLSWTMGEPIIETYSDGSNILTQGFQQSSYSVTAVENVNEPHVIVTVYPNPSDGIINIRSNENKNLNAELIEIEGKTVYRRVLENGQGEMNLGSLADGIYLLRVYDDSGKLIQTLKIQKVK
jgi:hypothetical protein